jgi:hypothetical protein
MVVVYARNFSYVIQKFQRSKNRTVVETFRKSKKIPGSKEESTKISPKET